jgi:hypothetical protein
MYCIPAVSCSPIVRYPRHVQYPSSETRCDGAEPMFFHICREQIMLIRKSFIVSSDLAYDTVCTSALRALGLMVLQASVRNLVNSALEGEITRGNSPPVIRVIAHEMHSRQVERFVARRTSRDMENARVIGICKLPGLLEFARRLQPIRTRKLLILSESSV